MALYRTQIYLRESQHLALKREAARRNKPMTELLRDLIDQHISTVSPSKSGPALQEITALGASGIKDASLRHDEFFGRPPER